MKRKTQKRKEALARREKDLAFWTATDREKRMPVWKVRRNGDNPEKKAAIAERDILALRIKLGMK